MHRVLLIAGLSVALPWSAAAQPAGRRLALVVGNDAYPDATLVNARSDARLVGQALNGLGFSVTSVFDVTREQFAAALAGVAATAQRDDLVVFYFAGHGVEVGGNNYLFPVDFRGQGASAVTIGGIRFSDVQESLSKAGRRVFILDACRTNPYLGVRAGGGGLARVNDAVGSIVAFSAAPGQTASDMGAEVEAPNGLFASELVKVLGMPGLEIREIFAKVREEVYRLSRGMQTPAISDLLLGRIVLRPASESLADFVRSLVDRSAPGIRALAVPAVFVAAGNDEARQLRDAFTARLQAVIGAEAKRKQIDATAVAWDRVDTVVRGLGLSATDAARAFYDVRIAPELGRLANADAVVLTLVDSQNGSSRVEMRLVSTATSTNVTSSIVVPEATLLPQGLLVRTNPRGAAVTLRGPAGVAAGKHTAPNFIEGLTPGSYAVIAEMRGWKRAQQNVFIVENSATVVQLALEENDAKWTVIAGCLSAGTAGAWALYQRASANDHYQRYQDSTTSDTAVIERSRAETADRRAKIASSIAGGAGAVCAIPLWKKLSPGGRSGPSFPRTPAVTVALGDRRRVAFGIRF